MSMSMSMPVRWSLERGMVVRRLGAGPEVVWIHGLGEHGQSFEAIARHPALAGFTHVMPDLPGYGRSAWPAVSADEGPARDSLADLADQLAGWLAEGPPRLLAGHSLGGVLATLVAERTSVRAVLDIDGNLSRGDCTFSATAAAQDVVSFHAHGFARMRDDVYAGGLSEPALRGYHVGLTLASPEVFHANAVDLVALSTTETLAARLAATRVPALFIAGAPGGICARSHALLGEHGIRCEVIAPAGHWPFVDQPDAFAAAAAAFLRAPA